MYSKIITKYTAQQSLYVKHRCHYLQYSGHYMYSTAVTICTEQLSLYEKQRGYYM